ncbi:MAG: helix-turn-helix transcriptional regulator [Clostridia bacterium]|nr:helix-turn-helix transcriptional regulator [Clostridia bacterium]
MSNTTELNKEIGARIKELRLKKNITQDTLSELVNVCSAQQVSNIERGINGISVLKLKEICIALDANAHYILLGNTPETIDQTLKKCTEQMNELQRQHVIDYIISYAKSCGIEVDE